MFSRLCRTCMCVRNSEHEMIDIFATKSDESTIAEVISLYTSIQIDKNEVLPKSICNTCYYWILDFIKFNKKVVNVDLTLRKLIRDLDADRTEQNSNMKTEQASIDFSDDNTTDDCLKDQNQYSNGQVESFNLLLNVEKGPHEVNKKKEYICDKCSHMCPSPQSLSAHMRKIHEAVKKELSCSICNKVFKKLSHLKRHELSHDSNRLFKCNFCTKSLSSEQKLQDHINIHKGVQPYVCPICLKAFSMNSSLKAHIKIHNQLKAYLCMICGKSFDSNSNLSQHIKRHRGDKTFLCPLCPGKFVSKGELNSHMHSHASIKPYTCEECSSSFTTLNSLAKHKIVHLDIRPFECDVCTKKFKNKDHLKRHYRIHTGEKPYKCDSCDRAFAQSNDLVKHKRVHYGDKLYKCSHCADSFRLKTELRRHIPKHFVFDSTTGTGQTGVQETVYSDSNIIIVQYPVIDNKPSAGNVDDKNKETAIKTVFLNCDINS